MISNVYIYGAGNDYNRLASYLHLYKDINVLGIITTEKQSYNKIDGHKCITTDKADFTKADYVIIAVVKWQEIADILNTYGVGEDKIILSCVFGIPNFNWNEYLRLKSSNVTILSNWCLAGGLYKELGLQVKSPTYNMYCLGKDYLKFLRDYEYYLKQPMVEYIDDKYIEGTVGVESFVYKGILGNDIVWNFNHNVSASEAIEKWNVHAKRINYNNVVATMIMQTEEEAYQFEELPIDRKIGIFHKDLGLKSVIYCPIWEGEIRNKAGFSWLGFANQYLRNQKYGFSPVNWINFLNGDADYLRI
jgi:uncharacterized protein (DUF1919 family)